MEGLIPLVNQLQDVFACADVSASPKQPEHSLPQIVVIGSQSSGKSSVLENIVGREFLPRGTGIVTRRPLLLQLIHTPQKHTVGAQEREELKGGLEWGVFLHKKDQVFENFEDIRQEIIEETNRVSGNNRGISSKAIHLKIFSPRVPNLTLVDLPGIAKVPVGDQPSNIEQQIRQIVLDYISNPNSIILAVSAANTDIANSDALHLAMQVDPSGERTLGVISKLDLMDKGTHALDILEGKHIPLRLGYVGIVNRSQEDIQTGKKIEEALQYEAHFFAEHPIYSRIANKSGTSYLTMRMSSILVGHIRKTLPGLKARIDRKIMEFEKMLGSLGPCELQSSQNKGAFVLHLVSRFSEDYSNCIDGKSQSWARTRLSGGAKINHIFHNTFAQTLRGINPSNFLSDEDIRMAIRSSTGPRSPLFVPEVAFEVLVKNQIERLENPALDCLDNVFRELQEITQSCADQSLASYENLKIRIADTVSRVLHECLKPARSMVRNLIACELAYINTNHPDFMSGSKAVAEAVSLKKRKKATDQNEDSVDGKESRSPSVDPDRTSDREQIETEIIKILIESYFKIVRKHIQDAVPKAIMHFLVNQSKQNLQSELVKNLYKEDLFDQLLEENDSTAAHRNACMKQLSALRKAIQVLDDFQFNL